MLQFLATAKVSCGNLTGIPKKIPNLTSDIFLILEIAVPVILVIMGMLDMFKAITADKEDEMAKARKVFFKRLITGAIVFFVFAIVKFVVSVLDTDANSQNIINCMDCFINGTNYCTKDGEFTYLDCELDGFEFQLRNDGHVPGASVSGNGIYEVIEVKPDPLPDHRYKCPSSKEYGAFLQTTAEGDYTALIIYKKDNTPQFTYLDCELDGFEFQLRNDGHIPGASVSGNGIYEVIEVKPDPLPGDNNKCPSSKEYKAVLSSDEQYLTIQKR